MIRATVEFDYKAQQSDELTLKKGDIIEEVRQMSGGWWEGTLNGTTGVFPDNFVRVLPTELDNEGQPTVRLRRSGMRTCRVLFSYNPMNEDELQLHENDVIEVLGEVEAGWWRGKLGDKVGVFPSNFVKEELQIEETKKDTEAIEDKEEQPEKINPPVAAKEPEVAVSNGVNELPVMGPSLPPKQSQEFCQVRFSYTAMNEDELSLHIGNVITLLSRQTQEPGWWQGELNGSVGVFPDNFVQIISAEEAEKKLNPIITPKDEESTKQIPNSSPKADIVKSQLNQPIVKDRPTSPGKKPAAPPPAKKPTLPVSNQSAPPVHGVKQAVPKLKLQDCVDGAAQSHQAPTVVETTVTETGPLSPQSTEFDNVDRNAMLTHITVSRVKAPRRRPPSTIFKDVDSNGGIPNGNGEAKDESGEEEKESTSQSSTQARKQDQASPPKAPWVQELRMNQLRARKSQPEPPVTEKKPTPPPVAIPTKPSEVAKMRATTTPVQTPVTVSRTPRPETSSPEPSQHPPAIESPRVMSAARASNGTVSERPVAGQRPLSSYFERAERRVAALERPASSIERPIRSSDRQSYIEPLTSNYAGPAEEIEILTDQGPAGDQDPVIPTGNTRVRGMGHRPPNLGFHHATGNYGDTGARAGSLTVHGNTRSRADGAGRDAFVGARSDFRDIPSTRQAHAPPPARAQQQLSYEELYAQNRELTDRVNILEYHMTSLQQALADIQRLMREDRNAPGPGQDQ